MKRATPKLDFHWDDGNTGHLGRHGADPQELEQLILGEPSDLEYKTEAGENRYKSLGTTVAGRVLMAVLTVRECRIRAVTAYRANKRYRDL